MLTVAALLLVLVVPGPGLSVSPVSAVPSVSPVSAVSPVSTVSAVSASGKSGDAQTAPGPEMGRSLNSIM